ncbi:MAG: PQQ-dependent sugar dehydrogenase [Bacteroidia bacterium]
MLAGQPAITLSPFATGLDRPVELVHAGDDRLFVVERPGRIRILRPDGSVDATPFLNISARVLSSGSNELGLLGLAFHPDYASNGYFFVNYTTGNNANKRSRISRFSRDAASPDLADPNSELILLEVSQPHNNHNGGALHFGPDGYLYSSFGDGGSQGDPQGYAQSGQSLLGKIIRLDVDGSSPYAIPADNPFVGSAAVRDEVWSIGWRNPWRFSFDRQTGDMWIGDVGQDKFEEISFEAAGSGGINYGWRCYEGQAAYNTNNCGAANTYAAPAFVYGRGSNGGQSVTGGYVYRGQAHAALFGYYVMGDYVSGNFWALRRDSAGAVATVFQGKLMNNDQCSAFGEDASGELYVAAYNAGIIYKIGEATTSIDPQSTRPLRLYPQPMQTSVQLDFPNTSGERFTLSLFDSGLRQVRFVEGIAGETYVLQRGSLPAGVYLVSLRGSKGSLFAGKVVVVD